MGAKYIWNVKVWDVTGTTSTDVTFQSLQINYGRDQPTDDFSAGTISISGIAPDSLPARFKEINSIVSCELVRKSTSTVVNTFWVKTRSLSRTYGTVANLDSWQYTGAGSFNQMTEQQLTATYSTTAGTTTTAQAGNLLSTYGISHTYSAGSSFVSGFTYEIGTYVSDIVQRLIRTEQGRIIDVVLPVASPPLGAVSTVVLESRDGAVMDYVSAVFNDGTATAGATDLTYTSVEFLNSAEYLANTVIVEPEGLADQVSGTTKPVLNFQTLDQTTTQAADLAGYIKNTLTSNTVRPLAVSMLIDAQTTEAFVTALWPGAQVQVALRGTVYDCVVEGASLQANPSSTTATLKLSSADAYSFLRLDDVTFGILDTNKLGF